MAYLELKYRSTEWIYVPSQSGFFRLQGGELIYCPCYYPDKNIPVLDPHEAQDIDWGHISRENHAVCVAVKEALICLTGRGIEL